jgi:hypothetical protein
MNLVFKNTLLVFLLGVTALGLHAMEIVEEIRKEVQNEANAVGVGLLNLEQQIEHKADELQNKLKETVHHHRHHHKHGDNSSPETSPQQPNNDTVERNVTAPVSQAADSHSNTNAFNNSNANSEAATQNIEISKAYKKGISCKLWNYAKQKGFDAYAWMRANPRKSVLLALEAADLTQAGWKTYHNESFWVKEATIKTRAKLFANNMYQVKLAYAVGNAAASLLARSK